MKQAVIDLGTNTFHLMIEEREGNNPPDVLFRESRPAKIGKAGINQSLITDEAMDRAMTVLRYFREQLDRFGIAPETVTTIGTSAIRVARNQAQFIGRVQQETGLQIRVISGDEEAEFIYRGVRAAGALGRETALVIDIGGGSVEFVLGNETRVFWKQSFEIGGQRLLERFMPERRTAERRTAERRTAERRTADLQTANLHDTISPATIRRLHDFFREQLLPLHNAVHQYQPTVLVGSSGSFDTLVDMDYQHRTGQWPPREQIAFSLPVAEFYRSYEALITRNHDERMQLPGMIELRVDMIVVAVCLIDYVLRTFEINTIRVSTYALKEGVLASGH